MKLTLFLTEQCNRKCKYCDIGISKTRNKPSLYYIRKYCEIIAKMGEIDTVVFTGGEVGLMSQSILDFLFETLRDKHIHVNTNGTFIKKGYYKKYHKYINDIMYHPVSEINQDIECFPLFPVKYHFPVHKKNIHLLSDFLDKNSILVKDFNPSPYDMKYETDDFKLNLEDFQKIFDIIHNRRNVSDYSIKVFKKIIRYWDKKEDYRKVCRKTFYDFSIDFINLKIKKCCCSHSLSSSVDLNEENLRNLKDLKFNKSPVCDSCFHFIHKIIQWEKMI